jgi:iron complex outermembrane receptor protein
MKLPFIEHGAQKLGPRARIEKRHRNAAMLSMRKRALSILKNPLVSLSVYSTLLFPTAQSFSAQVPSRELLLFMEVPTVVTPARREQPLTRAPSTTTVISAEEIRRSGLNNIPDILRMVAGLDVFRISVSDVNVTARGLNTRIAHRMQVFIDGRSVYEDFLNLVSWHELPISLQEIERIEIVKSPASALFGANAFSGVIHIITKSPETLKGTQITEIAGNAGTNITNVLHAGVLDKFSYKFTFEHDRTNNFPNPLIGRSSDDKGREDFRGNLFAEYKLNERSRASFSAGIDYFDRDIDPGLVPGPTPTRVLSNGGLGFVKFNYSLADFKAQFVWDRIDMDLRSAILPKTVPFLGSTYKLDAQHSLHLGTQNIVTGGASYRYTMFDSRFLVGPERKENLFAVFLQNEYSPVENLTFTLGLQVDTHPEAGVHVSPRGVVVYSPWENHIFRASISRAFRNPSVLENFVNFGVSTPFGPVNILGDRNAAAEEIVSYELGYQTLLFQRLKARVDLFYNQLDDLSTGPVPTGPPPSPITIQNGGGGSIFGSEFGLEFLISDWLKGFTNYSFQHRSVSDARVLGMGPRHKGNVGLSLDLPKGFEADVFVNIVGPSSGFPGKVDAYNTVNLRLGYQFELLGSKGRLMFGVANLFNDRHREIPGGDIIERRITGGFQFKF